MVSSLFWRGTFFLVICYCFSIILCLLVLHQSGAFVSGRVHSDVVAWTGTRRQRSRSFVTSRLVADEGAQLTVVVVDRASSPAG